MANDWFRFKEFNVVQRLSGMKVSTDACILGAWTADFIKNPSDRSLGILDIGTGTGLLSLMLAQNFPYAGIDAIDTDMTATEEATANFANSPWKQHLNAYHSALQDYKPEKKYDLIICNPPFFHKQLQATDHSRNIARHDISLSKKDLACNASSLLATSGYLSVLFPASEWDSWLIIAAKMGLGIQAILSIFPQKGRQANRVIGIFSREPVNHTKSYELTIRENADTYTAEFIALMRPYYLYL